MTTRDKIKLNDIKRKVKSKTREEYAEEFSPLSISGHNFFRAENHPELMKKDIFNQNNQVNTENNNL